MLLQAVSSFPLLRLRAPGYRTRFLSLLRRVGGDTARSLALLKSYGRILIKRHSGRMALNAQVLQLREVRVVQGAAQFNRLLLRLSVLTTQGPGVGQLEVELAMRCTAAHAFKCGGSSLKL